MTRAERELAIVTEAQLRANSSGSAQRVYWAYSSFGIKPASADFAGETVAVIQPAAVALAYERPTVAPAGPYSSDLLI